MAFGRSNNNSSSTSPTSLADDCDHLPLLTKRKENYNYINYKILSCFGRGLFTASMPRQSINLIINLVLCLDNVNGLRKKVLKTDILVGRPRAITMTLTAQAKTGTNKSSHV